MKAVGLNEITRSVSCGVHDGYGSKWLFGICIKRQEEKWVSFWLK